jgi:hypothetical protein
MAGMQQVPRRSSIYLMQGAKIICMPLLAKQWKSGVLWSNNPSGLIDAMGGIGNQESIFAGNRKYTTQIDDIAKSVMRRFRRNAAESSRSGPRAGTLQPLDSTIWSREHS